MPCIPLPETNIIAPNPGQFPGLGGFAVSIPNLNIPFPSFPLEDLTSIFNSLSFVLPSGLLKPHLQLNVFNDIYGAISTLLEGFAPFLMLYKFFLPVLNLILCIIEVLCALMNPFSLISAINKLFRECIPAFLSLFPFLAIVIMIISLLLLILTLIDYLISRILSIIDTILANLEILGKAAVRHDSDSILEIVNKIGLLLCSLQNLFVIFGVLTTILQIIKGILTLGFNIPPCDSSSGSQSGCCTPDVCPDFIKNNSDITYNTGNFLYLNEVGRDSGLTLPSFFPAITATIRPESWQFYDPTLSQRQAFNNITHAYDLPSGTTKVFFPGGTNYTTTTVPSSTPYIISFRFFYVPADFSYNPTDPKGPRYMKIANAIVENPPTDGVESYDNTLMAPFNGTLNLIGGFITEDDGTPLTDSQGRTIPLNTFIHKNPTSIPSDEASFFPNDGYLFSDLTYTFSINHEVLVGASLITLGCVPEVAANKDFVNATIGAQFNMIGANLSKVVLPDVATAQDNILNAITAYRESISIDTTNQFQTNIVGILNDLKQQTGNALAQVIPAAFDQYKSTFTLDTNIQFITQPVVVSVSLNESSGQSMTTNLPVSVASSIAAQLSGNVSLGNLTPFVYDGYQFFTADITSDTPGHGAVKVAFNNNYISILNNPTNVSQTPSVTVKELDYTFIYSPALSNDGLPRRDNGDIARDLAGDNNG